MAKYKVAGNSVVRIDRTAGGTLDAISTYVDTIEGIGREYDALDVTQFTDSAERVIPGIERAQEIVLRGAFDDAATTGPDAILSTVVGTIVTFEWNPRGTASGARKFTGEFLVVSYHVVGEVKGRVNYEARLKLDNAMTVGTN